MFAALHSRHSALARYAGFNGALVLCAMGMAGHIADMAATIKAETMVVAASAGPSRVEQFKRNEAAAALAPQVPVARKVVALSVPDMPVQVLAVRLDRAETVKVRPIKAKRKIAGRMTKAKTVAKLRTPAPKLFDLPAIVVATALAETGAQPEKRARKRAVIAESSRDITNRSLGVLVAMKY